MKIIWTKKQFGVRVCKILIGTLCTFLIEFKSQSLYVLGSLFTIQFKTYSIFNLLYRGGGDCFFFFAEHSFGIPRFSGSASRTVGPPKATVFAVRETTGVGCPQLTELNRFAPLPLGFFGEIIITRTQRNSEHRRTDRHDQHRAEWDGVKKVRTRTYVHIVEIIVRENFIVESAIMLQ